MVCPDGDGDRKWLSTSAQFSLTHIEDRERGG
jgi:hypothetical protein